MTISQLAEPTVKVKVWDIGVRLFHWAMVTSVASAYFLAENRPLHRRLGYMVIALIGFRVVWGLIGGHHARFRNFVPGPRKFFRYINDMSFGREARYLGHNPAGAAMIVALLCMLSAVGATGYMLGMDAYFGVEWVEDVHKLLVNGLLVLIFLHVCGVVVSSRRHRENLVMAMITGQKDIDGHDSQ
jgi:cytochrome b